jgi:hypothetical protein
MNTDKRDLRKGYDLGLETEEPLMIFRVTRLGTVLIVALAVTACSQEPAPSRGGRSAPGEPASTPAEAVSTPDESAPDAAPSTSVQTSGRLPGVDSPATDVPFWPRFHGPDGDNLSTETGLLKQWPEGGPELAWSTKGIGHGFASVSIAGGMIYTNGNVDDKTMITALDMDGNIRWQVENGAAWTKDVPGTRGTPTLDGDRLYHESPLGQLVSLDAASGEQVWTLNILEEFGAENIQWALA